MTSYNRFKPDSQRLVASDILDELEAIELDEALAVIDYDLPTGYEYDYAA